MVVSHDCGDSLDVHPSNKRPIGERLARLALNKNYAYKKIVCESPSVAGIDRHEGFVRIALRGRNDTNRGLHAASGDRIIGFEVAGEDGIFHPAEARVEDYFVLLTCPEVAEPVEVRYAWQPFTRANLVNSAGLPLSTFKARVSKRKEPWVWE